MPLEKLPPAEKFQQSSADKQAEPEKRLEKTFEMVPETKVRKQILISSPVTIAFKEDTGGHQERVYDKVPATFTVLKTEEKLYRIADDQGNEIGYIEKSPEVQEWNTRMAVMPRGDSITLFPSRENAQLNTEGSKITVQGNSPVFPVLESRVNNDNDEFEVRVGSPLGNKPMQNVTFPQWVRMSNTDPREEFRLGLFSSEVQLRRHMNRMESFERELQLRIQPTERGNARDLLHSVAISALQTIAGQPSIPNNTNLEDLQTVFRKLGVPEDVNDNSLPNLEGLARAPADEMVKFIERLQRSRKNFADIIQNPASADAKLNGVSVGKMHDAKGKEVRHIFVPLGNIPLLP